MEQWNDKVKFNHRLVVNNFGQVEGELYIYTDCEGVCDLFPEEMDVFQGNIIDNENWSVVFVNKNNNEVLFKAPLNETLCLLEDNYALEVDNPRTQLLLPALSIADLVDIQKTLGEQYTGIDQLTDYILKAYPKQYEPLVVGPVINLGHFPLDSLAVYDGGSYWHFITQGLTDTYHKSGEDINHDGYGFEFTIKVLKSCCPDVDAYAKQLYSLFETLANDVIENGSVYRPNEFIKYGDTIGIDPDHVSQMTGFITCEDKELKSTYLLFGKVQFIEVVAVTSQELEALLIKTCNPTQLLEKIGTDITNFNRPSCY